MSEPSEYLARATRETLRGDFPAVVTLLNDGLPAAMRTQAAELSRMYSALGVAERMIGNHLDLAVAHHYAAIGAAANPLDKAHAHTNLADSFRKLGMNGAAHKELDIAMTIPHLSSAGPLELAAAIDQRGLLRFVEKNHALALGHYDDARKHCEAALAAGDTDVVQDRLAQIFQHTAVVYVFREPAVPEEHTRARVLLSDAIRILTLIGDEVNLSNAHATLGKVELLQGNSAESIAHYEQALRHAQTVAYNANINGIGIYLVETSLATGNFAEAQTHADTFVDGIKQGFITEHDVNIYENRIRETVTVFEQKGLKTDGLKGLLALVEKK